MLMPMTAWAGSYSVILRNRGRSVLIVLERYHDTVKPSHLQFIEPSKRYADIIIPGGGENQVGIEVLISIIEKHLPLKKSKKNAG